MVSYTTPTPSQGKDSGPLPGYLIGPAIIQLKKGLDERLDHFPIATAKQNEPS